MVVPFLGVTSYGILKIKLLTPKKGTTTERIRRALGL